MNRAAHWMGLYSAVWLLAIGIPEVLRVGPRFQPASWSIILAALPDGIERMWPGLFVAAGVMSAWGLRSTTGLRLGFILTGIVYGVWGCVSMYGWATDQGGTIPGSASYFILAGWGFQLAHNVAGGVRADAIDAQLARGAEALPAETQERIDGATD